MDLIKQIYLKISPYKKSMIPHLTSSKKYFSLLKKTSCSQAKISFTI